MPLVRRLLSLALAALTLAGTPAMASAQEVVPGSADEVKLTFAPLVRQVAPAVVNVYVRRRVKQFVSPFDDPVFRRFFGDDFGVPQERIANSLGSGVIVSADGLVVTNAHVIKGGGQAEIRVALTDKREFDAKLMLSDERNDLAVLKIDVPDKTFPFLQFDDSDKLQVGDLVLAIGNPFGVGQTVTSGIVSALARTAVGAGDAQYFIQTDAAINPGNSGGALIDMQGKLVGINTAIYSKSGGSIGIGFAIPSNLVKPFVDSAITGREIKRPWLGVKFEPVTRELSEALGLERVLGAFVADVYEKSPAEAAGIKVKDVIIAVDGVEVDDPRALTYRLNTKGVGATVTLKVIRDGAERTVEVALAEAPGLEAAAQRELAGAHPLDGARVAELSPAIAAELGLPRLAGVVVVDVKGGSIAQGLGLKPGDLVRRVGRSRIDTLDELERVLGQPTRLWRLEIQRGDQVFQLALPG
jgi:Do/DeqQ family serine protease